MFPPQDVKQRTDGPHDSGHTKKFSIQKLCLGDSMFFFKEVRKNILSS
jgi:hypothetical protein